MKMINRQIPVLMPATVSLVELRALAESVGCIMKHDEITGMLAMVPRNECVRPAEDMQPKVVSIVGIQRKEKPETFLGKFKRFTMADHEPTPPSAA